MHLKCYEVTLHSMDSSFLFRLAVAILWTESSTQSAVLKIFHVNLFFEENKVSVIFRLLQSFGHFSYLIQNNQRITDTAKNKAGRFKVRPTGPMGLYFSPFVIISTVLKGSKCFIL